MHCFMHEQLYQYSSSSRNNYISENILGFMIFHNL